MSRSTSRRFASPHSELYPEDVELGFSLDDYKRLCREWRRKSDGFRRTKEARGFGIGGRQRQRAYYDALRDLAAPAMGHPPLVRIAALDGNGAAAFRRNRSVLSRLLTIGPTDETEDPAEGSTGSDERSSSPVEAVDLVAAVESSPATIVGVRDRPTLHDEIADILRADGPLTTRETRQRARALHQARPLGRDRLSSAWADEELFPALRPRRLEGHASMIPPTAFVRRSTASTVEGFESRPSRAVKGSCEGGFEADRRASVVRLSSA